MKSWAYRAKTDKETDNVETLGIQKMLLDTLKDLSIKVDFHLDRIEELEFRSRDGFSAHDRNRGGADFIAFTDVGSLMGSGYHTGTKIEEFVDKEYNEACESVDKDSPGLEENERYEAIDSITNSEYSGLAWRIRLMYEGDGMLVVHSGWDKDAPYYRWSNETDLVQEIKFKGKRDLKAKLKKALDKAVEKM